ncbi:PREDICTED: protein scarlet-like, partial [Ceratosolen solmsi marchali]|uniref:Protein scarlet-like n=1 Tax=Ceratosolen solmsi marchali TaxID=326594 RepID=A0AAJ6YTA6_9HYME
MKFVPKNKSEITYNNSTIITWRNLSAYTINYDRQVHKQVIHNVKGMLKSGELTGILGGSGSGKSSLMSALACRSP